MGVSDALYEDCRTIKYSVNNSVGSFYLVAERSEHEPRSIRPDMKSQSIDMSRYDGIVFMTAHINYVSNVGMIKTGEIVSQENRMHCSKSQGQAPR